MRALLDTHTFLWWNLNDPALSDAAREFIGDGRNEIYLSAASTWEIAIKAAKGRLLLPEKPDHFIAERMQLHRFSALPIAISHSVRVYDLPPIHADPFDRLLIAQSQLEGIPILTADSDIKRYQVDVIW